MKKGQVGSNYYSFTETLDMNQIPVEWHQLIYIFLYKNNQINLSSIRDPLWVYKKHILDSLELSNIIPLDGLKICDIGTWWWFPLLPLAIKFPNSKLTWVDSISKKISAIEDMISLLGLYNCTTLCSRVEDLKFTDFKPDIFTIRAVAYIDKLLSWTKNILKKWNKLVLYKLYTLEEHSMLISLLHPYKLELTYVHHYDLWDGTDRIIYILKKY